MITRVVKISVLVIAFFAVFGLSAFLTLTYIIKREDPIVVPDLVGKDVVYTLKILTDIGLNTKVKRSEYSSDIPEDHVIFQDPKPGAEIRRGRDIRVIISKGAKTVLMPNLQGLSIQQARIILENNGLCQRELSRISSQDIKRDDIIAQTPNPGVMIPRGKCVNLLVSIGVQAKAYQMPDLQGLSIEDAIFLIELNNLLPGKITSKFYKEKPQNIIVDQETLAGHRVIEGHIVNLVRNRKSGRGLQTYLNDVKGVNLFRYRLESGFLKSRIRVRLNSFGVSNDLLDDFMKPDEEIWLLIPKGKDATVFLYKDDVIVKSQVFDAW
ncbi:MAG: PASTA domain-containing protein [Desulfobacterales bacterium]|jgi:serine/threonine-protein kinase|nr:hypothetical protein [Desulfobacter sp.]MDP6394321.1 PASTA domain-containing protein [Desulfobacterales bacterium]MDP6807604.1 PASTA domain-containing protein [Desulfobacterales bacterium]|tara:strand:+ start:30462 stop:31433 length:972 start_codon:yes stop_codon:yes gene_type:complete